MYSQCWEEISVLFFVIVVIEIEKDIFLASHEKNTFLYLSAQWKFQQYSPINIHMSSKQNYNR